MNSRQHIPKITIDEETSSLPNNPVHTNHTYSFNSEAHLNQIQDKWLVNLSNTYVPHEVKLLLQLEGDFGLSLTTSNKQKTAVNFIKHIEKNLT